MMKLEGKALVDLQSLGVAIDNWEELETLMDPNDVRWSMCGAFLLGIIYGKRMERERRKAAKSKTM